MTTNDDQDIQQDIAELGRKADAQEVEAVRRATEIEREWWGDVEPFADETAIDIGLESGYLKLVSPTDGFLPILRYRNPELHHAYPPYLENHTLKLLVEIADKWRARADEAGIDKRARLAVTGLTTTTSYQQTLVKAGKLAIEGNPHSRGVAFDFDATGYYLGEIPVNHRPADKAKYDSAFSHMGRGIDAPDFLSDPELFNPLVHDLLREILDQAQRQSKLHYIQEYPGSNYSSFHVCRNPKYLPKA